MFRLNRSRDLFALSLGCLVLYFHFGFEKTGLPVRLLGGPLAAAAFAAALKWRWGEKLPGFRGRSENAVFSAVAALFLVGQLYFFSFPERLLTLDGRLHFPAPFENAPKYCYAVAVLLFAAGGWLAVKRLFLLVWRQVEEPVRELGRSLDRFDAALFLLGMLLLGAGMAAVFLTTNLFYYPCTAPGGGTSYDILFTSDNGMLTAECAPVNLFSDENDFRQILFALFSLHVLPFHLLAYFLPPESALRGIAYALPQLMFLEASCLLLARLLRLERWDKAAFFLLANSTFPVLLYSLMQEQYVMAVFFLLLYLLLRRGAGAGVLLTAAGGTLSSSAAALFLAPGESAARRFRVLFQAVLFGGGAVLLTAKWGLITKLSEQMSNYANFTGRGVPLAARFEQYFHFLAGCFVAPEIVESGRTLQLAPLSGSVGPGGVVVGALLLCGWLVNRRDERAQLCFRWMLFSVFLLLLVGWGSRENGMILYSLYFQWAACALAWLLAEKLFGGHSAARRLAVAAAACGMLAYNIPALCAAWRWGVLNYPAI